MLLGVTPHEHPHMALWLRDDLSERERFRACVLWLSGSFGPNASRWAHRGGPRRGRPGEPKYRGRADRWGRRIGGVLGSLGMAAHNLRDWHVDVLRCGIFTNFSAKLMFLDFGALRYCGAELSRFAGGPGDRGDCQLAGSPGRLFGMERGAALLAFFTQVSYINGWRNHVPPRVLGSFAGKIGRI